MRALCFGLVANEDIVTWSVVSGHPPLREWKNTVSSTLLAHVRFHGAPLHAHPAFGPSSLLAHALPWFLDELFDGPKRRRSTLQCFLYTF